MYTHRLNGLLALLAIAAAAHASYGKPELIRAENLKTDLEFIADDLLEGRGTPSRGLDLAALYLRSQLKHMGAIPAGDLGTFYQSFRVERRGIGGRTQNIVAIIPGRDPVLKNEYVAISAHYDHLGLAKTGLDTVFNGADDDGSGTTSVLSIARAFAMGPRPKRSILIIWHAGEERGLLGAKHFTSNPTVPLDKIVGLLNIDMIGRSRPAGDANPKNAKLSGPDEIYVVGSREISKEFGDIVENVNRKTTKLKYNYYYDLPEKPEGIAHRSDHWEYLKRNVPIAFWFDGVHEDYHMVTDKIGKIDFAKMERVARAVYATAWTFAEAPKRPKLDATR